MLAVRAASYTFGRFCEFRYYSHIISGLNTSYNQMFT